MGSAASWFRSFGIAIVIHALALAVVYDRTVRVADDSRLRALVAVRIRWEEPAPGPPTAAAAPASIAALPVPPPAKRDVPKPPAQRRGTRPASPPPLDPASKAAGDAGAAATAAVAPSVEGGGGGGGGGGSGAGDAPLALAAVARPPELVERVLPEYPARARALELEGQVVLEVVVDREGRPEPAIRVLRSQPPFDGAAVAAVRRWRFRPARDAEGHPVRVLMEVPVRFELR